VRFVFIGLCVLLSLLALFYAVEGYRGAKYLEKIESSLKASGEKLTMAELLPPEIPDDQNLAMSHLYRGQRRDADKEHETLYIWPDGAMRSKLFPGFERAQRPLDFSDWRDYILESVEVVENPEPYENLNGAESVIQFIETLAVPLDELHREALKRPMTRWSIKPDRADMYPRQLSGNRRASKWLNLRAAAYFSLGKTDEGLKDLCLSFRMASDLGQGGTWVGMLTATALDNVGRKTLTYLLETGNPYAKDLRMIQRQMRSRDILADLLRGLRTERAFMGETVVAFSSEGLESIMGADFNLDDPFHIRMVISWIGPLGWLKKDLAVYYERIQDLIDCVHIETGLMNVSAVNQFFQGADRHQPSFFKSYFISKMKWFLRSETRAQADRNMLIIACELEIFRKKHKRFPDQLSEIASSLDLQAFPDPVNGKPLKYIKLTDTSYRLYSVGWDQKDDGDVGSEKGNQKNTSDWVLDINRTMTH